MCILVYYILIVLEVVKATIPTIEIRVTLQQTFRAQLNAADRLNTLQPNAYNIIYHIVRTYHYLTGD